MTLDEETIDPKELLQLKCQQSKECAPLFERFVNCEKRVRSKEGKTSETCVEELFDLTPCVDKCIAKELFSKLK